MSEFQIDLATDPDTRRGYEEAERREMGQEETKKQPTTRARPLPDLRSGDWIAENLQALPDELIRALLHKGCKMALGGGSKSFKTWGLIDLAVSITTGSEWWGLETVPGSVAYLNFEVGEAFFHSRLRKVAEAKGVALSSKLRVWNLRGHAQPAAILLPKLTEQLKGEKLAAIVIDPVYKLALGTEENSAKETAQLMQTFENLAEDTGAAVIFGAHFSKGNQAGKEAMDRISGSGVYARDPDAILTMTRHSEDEAFTVDATLRNCPPVPAFAVRWEFPLMVPAPDLDPADLKQAKPGGGGRPVTALAILDELPAGEGWRAGQWAKHCREEFGISERGFYNLLTEAKKKHGTKLHQRADKTYVRVA